MNLNRLQKHLFEEFNRKCEIVEESQYTIKVNLPPGSKEGILIHLPKIKECSAFLSTDCNPPSDCDAIIIDVDKKRFFLIEAKSLVTTASPKHVKNQLMAGLEWLKFICFCLEVNFNDYSYYMIHVTANARTTTREQVFPRDDVYRLSGKQISLRHLFPY